MRTISILLLNVLFALCGYTQTMTIHYKSGQNVKLNVKNIDYIDFQEKSDEGTTVSEGEAVDLGLSVLWASCNVGANSCEQMGDKFAWGETETKEYFSERNYIWNEPETLSFTYLGDDICGTEFDVAHVKWGGEWEMPTRAEFETFKFSFEDYIWECRNGVYGKLFVAESGASIFLPAAGTRYCEGLYSRDEECYYWTSSYDEDHIHLAKYFWNNEGFWNCRGEGHNRCRGLSVRPVIK